MTDIIFLVDSEPGHIYPTIKLAIALREEGLKVCYAGLAQNKMLVEDYGFDYYGIPEAHTEEKTLVTDTPLNHFNLILSGGLDNLMKRLSPKLIVQSSFLSLEGLLLHYKYDVKLITYCSYFLEKSHVQDSSMVKLLSDACMYRFMQFSGKEPQMLLKLVKEKNISISSLNDLFLPLKKMPILMLCPKELKINPGKENKWEMYLGPGIIEKNESSAIKVGDFLPKGKKMIFVSMGSQVRKYPEKAKLFFKMIMNCMQSAQLVDYHLFLSVGGTEIDEWDLGEIEDNISVFKWLPQKEILKSATVAITHGGLGTIKECIFFETPMLVVPMGRDQVENAERITHHELGTMVNVEELNSNSLLKALSSLLDNQRIKEAVEKMGKLFRKKNDDKEGVLFLRDYVSAS